MNFYVVDNGGFEDDFFAYGEKFDGVNLGPTLKCEVCGSHLTLMKWLPPYEIKVSRKKLGDFIFGTFENFIVSSRFRRHFEEEDLKGISLFRPVSLYFRKTLLDEEYYFPEIEFADVAIDWKRSGIVFNGDRECPRCFRAGRVITEMKALIFEQPNNINLDIFNPKTFTELVVSERFRNFVLRYELTNLLMIESSQFRPWWIFN
jgi:hypothetical protein